MRLRSARFALIATASLYAATAFAQSADEDVEEAPPPGLPGMDIYLAPLTWDEAGAPSLGEFANATDRAGYDNQPFFDRDAAAFFYSAETDDGTTDIFRYDIETGERQAVIVTPGVGEYSPQRPPNAEEHVTVVRQDEEGVQNVYISAPLEAAYTPVLDLDPVGYYAWDESGGAIVMFVLGEPMTLQSFDFDTLETSTVFENPGRSIHALPGGGVMFSAPREDASAAVYSLTVDDGESEYLFDLPGEAQDFALVRNDDGDGLTGAFAADAGALYFLPAGEAEWREVAELSAHGIESATRIAVSADASWIAIVGADAEITEAP